MKLAWIVWMYEDDDRPELWFEEPRHCFKKVQIAYAEIVEH